jgi:hypothetical protein
MVSPLVFLCAEGQDGFYQWTHNHFVPTIVTLDAGDAQMCASIQAPMHHYIIPEFLELPEISACQHFSFGCVLCAAHALMQVALHTVVMHYI